MAFDDHPHQLNLKRKTSPKGKSYNYSPLVFDRHGHRIWKWDAYFTGVSNNPEDMRKRDVWELAEYLDERRKAAEQANKKKNTARETRLERIDIEATKQGDLRKYPGLNN